MSERISPEEHARYYTPEGCAQVRIPRGAFARQELIDLLS